MGGPGSFTPAVFNQNPGSLTWNVQFRSSNRKAMRVMEATASVFTRINNGAITIACTTTTTATTSTTTLTPGVETHVHLIHRGGFRPGGRRYQPGTRCGLYGCGQRKTLSQSRERTGGGCWMSHGRESTNNTQHITDQRKPENFMKGWADYIYMYIYTQHIYTYTNIH